MANKARTHAPRNGYSAPPHYVSFVLRCWVVGKGQVHVRLIEVPSGVKHAVSDLDKLPAMIRRLVKESLPPDSNDDVEGARP